MGDAGSAGRNSFSTARNAERLTRVVEGVSAAVSFALAPGCRTAAAARVDVRTSLRSGGLTNDQLHLAVRDAGKGFDIEAALATSGLGLVSMPERLKLVNGCVTIDSNPGVGTTVRATVPLASNAPDALDAAAQVRT